MSEQLTYRAIRERCESTAKEIVSENDGFGRAKDLNTFDAWEECLEGCRELAEELQANCEPDGPDDDDYILSGCGPLGPMTRVTQSGNCLYEGDQDGAERFILEHMETSQYWPSVWYVNDHGNISQVFLCEKGEES